MRIVKDILQWRPVSKNYTGPNFFRFYEKSVLIVPLISQPSVDDQNMERIQLPLNLCWAITIHKSQGLTLLNAWIDLGMQEKSAGLSYVAISTVKSLKAIVEPMLFERLTIVRSSCNF